MKKLLSMFLLTLIMITAVFAVSSFAAEAEAPIEIGEKEGQVSLATALHSDGVYSIGVIWNDDGLGGYYSDITLYRQYEVTADVTIIIDRVNVIARSGYAPGDYMFVIKPGASLTIKTTDPNNQSGKIDTYGAANLSGIFKLEGTAENPASLRIEGGAFYSEGSVITTSGNSIVEISKVSSNPYIKSTDEDGAAIIHNGGSLTIDGGNIQGATGIYMTDGTLSISGGTIYGKGTATDYNEASLSTGDAIAIDNASDSINDGDITITDGVLNSTSGAPVSVYGEEAQEDKLSGFIVSCTAIPKDKLDSSLLDPNSEFSGSNVTISAGFEEAGTEEDPYLIESLAELIAFRTSVNSGNDYQNKYIKLACDIDLSQESSWTPIGSYSDGVFCGMFDGDGHKISNLYIYAPEEDRIGFFRYTYSSAVIKNLIFENVDITGKEYVGAITAAYYGTVENCTVSGRVSGTKYVGGIAGECDAVIGCVNNATVTATDSYVGGVVGECESMIDCTNGGKVKGESYVGGVGGYASESIDGCVNHGAVEAGSRSGAILLTPSWSSMTTGTYTYAGGIVGCSSGEITDCINNGNVSGDAIGVAGITGMSGNYATVSGCVNNGEINAGLGRIATGTDEDEYGNTIGTSYLNLSAGGGISGYNLGAVDNCLNTGIVNGEPTSYSYVYANGEAEEPTLVPVYTTGSVVGVTGLIETSSVSACLSTSEAGKNSAGTVGTDFIAMEYGEEYATAKNNYYLAESEGEDGARTAAQFANGQVAHELSAAPKSEWGQDLSGNGELSLGADPVYKNNVTGEYTNTLSVIFESNGGSAIDAIHGLENGATISAPVAPTKAGYTFIGWFSDAELTEIWDFENDTVNDIVHLYAGWLKHSFSIKRDGEIIYYDNFLYALADVQSGDELTVHEDYTVPESALDFTKPDGYGEISFTINLNGKTLSFESNFASITLSGFNVNFKGDGFVDAIIILEDDSHVTIEDGTYKALVVFAPATVTLTGGMFKGLSDEESAAFKNAAIASGDEVMAAYATILGTNGIICGFAGSADDALEYINSFVDHSKNAYSEEVFELDLSSYDMGFAAAAPAETKILKRYTVKFDTLGLVTNPEDQIITDGELIIEPTLPSVTGRVFIGWYTNEGCTNAFDVATPITADITLYAKYANYKDDIDKIYSDLNSAKAELDAAISVGDSDLADEIMALKSALDDAKEAFAIADGELKAELLLEISESEAALYAAIDAVEEKLDNAKAELLAAIAAGKTELEKEIENIYAALDQAGIVYSFTSNSELKAELESKIHNSKDEMLQIVAAGDKLNATNLNKELEKLRGELADAQKNAQATTIIASVATGAITLLLSSILLKSRRRRYY